MVDRRIEVAGYPIERVEVPFDGGKTISCLLHLLPDRRKAPVRHLRAGHGPDQGGLSRRRTTTSRIARGFHVLAMDGPGQGSSNMQKIRAVGDNYERAGAAVISYLSEAARGRCEEDRDLRHQHGQLLVAAPFELRPSRAPRS